MKLRWIAMAGVAAAALSVPALANDATGWYLGLGVGYDQIQPVRYEAAGVVGRGHFSDSAIGALSFGYKFDSGFRLEDEISYDSHDTNQAGFSGSAEMRADLFNLFYDWRMGDNWKIYFCGGIGAGAFRQNISTAGATFAKGDRSSFMWQGIVGISDSISDDMDLYADYRYRTANIDHAYATGFVNLAPISTRDPLASDAA